MYWRLLVQRSPTRNNYWYLRSLSEKPNQSAKGSSRFWSTLIVLISHFVLVDMEPHRKHPPEDLSRFQVPRFWPRYLHVELRDIVSYCRLGVREAYHLQTRKMIFRSHSL